MTSALEGTGTGRLYPQDFSGTPLRDWVDPGHIELSEATEKFPVTPPTIDPGTFQLVTWCLNHYTTLGPVYTMDVSIN
jgi:hypothetical protein